MAESEPIIKIDAAKLDAEARTLFLRLAVNRRRFSNGVDGKNDLLVMFYDVRAVVDFVRCVHPAFDTFALPLQELETEIDELLGGVKPKRLRPWNEKKTNKGGKPRYQTDVYHRIHAAALIHLLVQESRGEPRSTRRSRESIITAVTDKFTARGIEPGDLGERLNKKGADPKAREAFWVIVTGAKKDALQGIKPSAEVERRLDEMLATNYRPKQSGDT